MAVVSNKIENVYPLTPLQEGMLFHHLANPDSTEYILQYGHKVEFDIDNEYVEKALALICTKYSALRTAFAYKKTKEIYQVVLAEREIEFNYVDIEQLNDDEKNNEIEKLLTNDVNRGFDLMKDSLLRVTRVKYGSEDNRLIFTFHHIIVDGWCIGIVMNGFWEYYKSLCNGVSYDELLNNVKHEKETSNDYSDYIKWLIKQDKEKAKNFWANELLDYDSEAKIEALQKPEKTGNQMKKYTGSVDFDCTEKIKELSKNNNATINTAAEVAVGILLQRYSGSNDVVFGKVVSGRNAPINGIEKMVGLFINTIPVRVNIDDKTTVAELLKTQQKKGNECTGFDYYSLAEIQNNTKQGSNLINVIFVYENYMSGQESDSSDENGNQLKIEYAREQTNYGITISATEIDNKLSFQILYDPNQYCDEEVKLIMDRLLKICEEIAVDPLNKVSEIDAIDENEKNVILTEFNNVQVDYPRNKTIAEIFEEQVEKTPDNVAVVFEDERLTYAQLNNRANQLAKKLVEQGVKPGDYVALYIERSIEMIVGIYGIIKAGAVYVPINTMYPDDRVEYILKDCNAGVLILGDTKLDVDYEGKRINLKEEKLEENECANPEILVKPESGLYVIYTSGTTGKPKGCEVMHKNVVRLLFNDEFEFDFNEDDVWTMFHSYGFDFSVWEMYGATLYGGKLVVVSEDEATDTGKFLKILKEQKVTVLNQVPTAFYNLDYEDKGEDLCVRYLIFGGEALDPSKLRGWKEKHPETKIINMYGITETTVHVTYREIGEEEIERGISDIGRAIPTLNVYIMNGDTMCGIGMPGELCVTGEGLAKGYLNRPELTAEKFVKNPFGEGRMYRSGDLARWLPDGNIEYLGRIDEQVKIRGFRIELGEIESRIREIEGIRDAAVIARKDNSGSNAIYAYFVAEDGGKEISLSDLRETLSVNLPDYMIPAYMMQIEAIPVTKNGKLDRRALPDIEAKTEKEYIAPRNELEKSICEIFSELLGVEKVGVKDGFFELGGHSLRATRLVNRIEEQTGKRIALKDVFSNQTPEKIAMLVNSENEDEYESIPKAEEKEYYPMSSAQKRTYLLSQMDPDGILYNMPANYKLTGEVRPEALREALQKLIDRHEILRTSFIMVDGEPAQKILPHVEADFEYVKHSDENDEELIKSFVKPFNLSNPPLVRVRLVNRGEYYLLSMDMHHITGDGMSLAIFTRELNALYNREELAPLTHQFKDYSEWMRTRNLSNQADYWKSQFDDEIPVLDMPLDYVRPQEQSFKGDNIKFDLGKDLTEKIREISRENGTTDFMVFMSAAMILLSKYSRQEDIVIGTPISGRTHRDTEDMLGMFVNTLAMRGKPEANKTYKEFLSEIKETSLKAYENQEYPFEELVEAVDVTRDMSRNPLFDVMLSLQNNEEENLSIGKTETEWIGTKSTISKFDLSFIIGQYNDEYQMIIEYCTDLFKDDSIKMLLTHFVNILDGLKENIEKKIGEIEVVDAEEKEIILKKFNDENVEYLHDNTIVELFEEQVEKTPENTAVVFEDSKLTYRELNENANTLAKKLREMDVKPDDFVGIIADRSLEMIEAIYGVIKSGGVYVPIDPTYPEERIKFMLEDSNPKAVLVYTNEGLSIINDIDIPVIDLADGEVFKGMPENPERVNKPEDLMYCIYTSGTTGNPKGVDVEHCGAVVLCNEVANKYSLQGKHVLQMTNVTFDPFVEQVFSAHLSGATLFVANETERMSAKDLFALIKSNNIEVANVPLVMLRELEGYLKDESSLKTIICGGEQLPEDLKNKVLSYGISLYNHYGPTETIVDATVSDCTLNDKVTIGKPCFGKKAYILQGDSLCGIGVPGELCIGGELARGYHNLEALTNEKFVSNPFADGRMYRTGDLARWLPDGNIEFLGRIDEQVKVRGFRVELGEIESRIREIEGISDATVIAKVDSTGNKAIYAYFVVEGEKEIASLDVRESLSVNLPEYMIPAYMMQIDSIPVTKNGKVDRRALPDIEAKTEKEYIEPRNELEEKICNAFSEILGVEKVGIKDGFFELGGHSLRATRLVNRIEEQTGKRIALKDVFSNQTPEKIALLVNDENEEEYVSIPKAEEKEYYPMSSAQKRTYLLAQMNPDGIHYNMPANYKLTGEVRPEALKEALQKLIDRHEILRTSFIMVDGEPMQKILPHVEADFEYIEYSDVNDEELIESFVKSFDLSNPPLVRIQLVNKEEYYLLSIDMHHIVGDGMSMGTFMSELNALYNREELIPLNHQFKDYSEWMRTRDLSNQADYWKSQFDDEIPVLDMPLDYVRPQEQSFEGALAVSEIDEKLTAKIKEVAAANGTTEFMVFMSAAMVLLSKYSRQEDIVIGTPISGRTHRDTEGMLGMFVNTLAMRGKPEANKTYREFLAEIKETSLKAYENQEYPFEELVEAVDVTRDMARSPLFDVMLVLQNNEVASVRFGDAQAEWVNMKEKVAKFDLTFSLGEYEGKYSMGLEYCTALYKEESIKGIMNHFVTLLDNLMSDTDKKLKDVEIVSDGEKTLLLNDFNDVKLPYSKEKTIVELFEEQVEKTPNDVAVVCKDKELTYRELNEKANILACKLRNFGVKPNDFVAILTEKSLEMVIAIYGVLKSGGAYIPINVTYPEDRIKYIIEDSKSKVLITYEAELSAISDGMTVIDLEKDDIWEEKAVELEHVNKPTDILYAIYTSGTTGQPKGVMIEHRSLNNYLLTVKDKFFNVEGDIPLFTNYAFDLTVTSIWGSILSGKKLVVCREDADLLEYAAKNQLAVVKVVPTHLMLLLEESKKFGKPQINRFMLGGEAVTDKIIEKIHEVVGEHVDIINEYGPTECTVACSYAFLEKNEKITIGKPFYNCQLYVVNQGKLCGIGVPGELCIAGDCVAKGYLNKEEMTEEKFENNPFGEGKMYHTGDLALWLPDGNIDYLGRIDEQVKIRGFRIELGEIESQIREVENVKDAAVIAREDNNGEKAIYAYYVAEEGKEILVSDVRESLSAVLPNYMIPAYMMQIESIPVTKNGKLDKKALPDIEAKTEKEYIAPRNELEKTICDIFRELLGVEKVGIKDGFFEFGGHSLKATRLVNSIEEHTGHRIALKNVFSNQTPEKLALLASNRNDEEYVPIPKAEEKEYYAMSSTQKRTYLTSQIDSTGVLYNIPEYHQVRGEIDLEAMNDAFQKVVDRHEILRTSFLIVDGEAVQKILPHVCVKIDYIEYDDVKDLENEDDLYFADAFVKSFDLSNPPLVRIQLINRGEYHLMCTDMHHIISDGMSLTTFLNELVAIYNGEELKPLTRQFKDYSEWMRTRDLSSQAEYWKGQFEGEVPVFDMPYDHTRPQEKTYKGGVVAYGLGVDLTQRLRKLASNSGVTDYMLFMAATMVLLSKYSYQEDIVVGTPISGRTHKDTEQMLGMFVNTLAMRGKPEKNKTFREFLMEIKDMCFKAYENQDYPIEELLEELNIPRDLSRNPLFDVMFVLQNNDDATYNFNGLEFDWVERETTVSKTDLSFIIGTRNNAFEVVLGYCTDLIEKESARKVYFHYFELLNHLDEYIDKKIGEIDIVSDREKAVIFNKFNDTEAPYPSDKTIVDLFEEQVEKTPEKIAIIYEGDFITYRDLNERANQVAYRLRKVGVGRNDLVAMSTSRSLEMMIGIYGIIKAGGAYVPMDPAYPEDRISFMLEDSSAKAVLVYDSKINTNLPVIDLSDMNVFTGASDNLEHVNEPEDLLYCIYTSGTTGRPKGVMISHYSVINLCKSLLKEYVIDAENVSLVASYIFDASIQMIFAPILEGKILHIISDERKVDGEKLLEYYRDNNIDVSDCTPSHLKIMLSSSTELGTCINTLLVGGEELPLDVAKSMLEKKYCERLINVYGPTECTVDTTAHEISIEDDKVLIGKPIGNSKIFILDGNNLCGIGMPGELCIAGNGVSNGYLNRADLTAEKFVNNPYGEGKMYRSGDLAVWTSDGSIEYLGRIDEQVKIRGFRIELGEIESRIREIEGIKDVAVIAKNDNSGSKAIYAYLVSKNETKLSLTEIREELNVNLPDYMLPSYMMQIESIPVTKNGKLDRRALPEIQNKTEKEYIAPRNVEEEAVCKAFAEILNTDYVGVKDNFFELGGDSIKAIRIISKLRNIGYIATVKDIMNGKTVEKISQVIKAKSTDKMYEQGEVVGKVEITPIIREFTEWNLNKPEHFNQSMMFMVDGIDSSIIKSAMKEIVIHHDILRVVYRDDKLEILPVAESKLFDYYEFDYSEESDKHKLVHDKCTEIQGSIDLSNGPIVKVAVFELGETKQMMVCIHHLAVDGVSWRILSEDFETLVNQIKKGTKPCLPEKTASFVEWSKKLNEYGERISFKDKMYWKKVDSEMPEGKIPREYSGNETGFALVQFDKKITEELLTKSINAYGAKIDEVLIAGLARAIGRITGQKKLALKNEGHGREEIHEQISIDRTVGWFTNIYSVIVDVSEDNAKSIVASKDALRAIPGNGMGYGFVKHSVKPDITFNYLGEFNINQKDDSEIWSSGEDSSSENVNDDVILVNGGTYNGVLSFVIKSNDVEYDNEFIAKLSNEFEKAVIELAEYCTLIDNNEVKTNSDLSDDTLDNDELEYLNSLID